MDWSSTIAAGLGVAGPAVALTQSLLNRRQKRRGKTSRGPQAVWVEGAESTEVLRRYTREYERYRRSSLLMGLGVGLSLGTVLTAAVLPGTTLAGKLGILSLPIIALVMIVSAWVLVRVRPHDWKWFVEIQDDLTRRRGRRPPPADSP